MPEQTRYAVVGAGLAGLTCARGLADAGKPVVVFDKGRGLGGRMASRRRDGWRFDHGAISLRPTEQPFSAFIAQGHAHGHAAPWTGADGSGTAGWTGLPGMSGSVSHLADGLTIHRQARVTRLERGAEGWVLHGPQAAEGLVFDHLVLAIPQPQAHELLAPWPSLQARIASASMAPCWTLMAGFAAPLPTDIAHDTAAEDPIAVISCEGSKPGRALPGDGWVIQATADWSRRHLEAEHEDVVAPLLDAFFARLGCAPRVPDLVMAHRWRYARTSSPLGQAFLTDESLGLSLCGDWCLGPTAQDAFNSGRHLAAALTGALHC